MISKEQRLQSELEQVDIQIANVQKSIMTTTNTDILCVQEHRLEDLLDYRANLSSQLRSIALDKLVADAQEMDMGY